MVDGDAGARIRAAVRSIGVHARAANLDRSARLTAAFDAGASGALSEPEREEAADVAHQLVGSAGTFGFPTVSELAAELETFFADGGFGDPVRVETARGQLHRLQEELAAGPSYTDGT